MNQQPAHEILAQLNVAILTGKQLGIPVGEFVAAREAVTPRYEFDKFVGGALPPYLLNIASDASRGAKINEHLRLAGLEIVPIRPPESESPFEVRERELPDGTLQLIVDATRPDGATAQVTIHLGGRSGLDVDVNANLPATAAESANGETDEITLEAGR